MMLSFRTTSSTENWTAILAMFVLGVERHISLYISFCCYPDGCIAVPVVLSAVF